MCIRDRRYYTRLFRACGLAGVKQDDPLLSCFVLLISYPDLPQIPCCAHAAPPRSFPFCFAGCPSTVIPLCPIIVAQRILLVIAAQKSTPKSLAQCKHEQGRLVKRYKVVAFLAHAILTRLLSPPLESGCRRLRLDSRALLLLVHVRVPWL